MSADFQQSGPAGRLKWLGRRVTWDDYLRALKAARVLLTWSDGSNDE